MIAGSLSGLTVKVMVFGTGSVSAPPLAVPPSSTTEKSKLVDPLKFVSGVKTSIARSAIGMVCPAMTGVPSRVRVPFAGRVSMMRASKLSATGSTVSLKPKSAGVKVWGSSSPRMMVSSMPAGASLTGFTVIVVEPRAILFAAPLSSVTENVKFVLIIFATSAGASKVRASSCAIVSVSPFITALPPLRTVPLEGRPVTVMVCVSSVSTSIFAGRTSPSIVVDPSSTSIAEVSARGWSLVPVMVIVMSRDVPSSVSTEMVSVRVSPSARNWMASLLTL